MNNIDNRKIWKVIKYLNIGFTFCNVTQRLILHKWISNFLLNKIKASDAFNTWVFVTKPNDSSPWRRRLTTVAPQEVRRSLLIVQTVSSRIDLSLLKLRHRSKKWQVVSISNPQLQIGLRNSMKTCLNLWSRKWLNPRYNRCNRVIW